MNNSASAGSQIRHSAWRFILIVGLTDLFADMTYEDARGVVGDFLGQLGADATIVGIVAGGGELAGYLIVLGVIGSTLGLGTSSTCFACRRWPSPERGRLPQD